MTAGDRHLKRGVCRQRGLTSPGLENKDSPTKFQRLCQLLGVLEFLNSGHPFIVKNLVTVTCLGGTTGAYDVVVLKSPSLDVSEKNLIFLFVFS